jgi:hypothetical protein
MMKLAMVGLCLTLIALGIYDVGAARFRRGRD